MTFTSNGAKKTSGGKIGTPPISLEEQRGRARVLRVLKDGQIPSLELMRQCGSLSLIDKMEIASITPIQLQTRRNIRSNRQELERNLVFLSATGPQKKLMLERRMDETEYGQILSSLSAGKCFDALSTALRAFLEKHGQATFEKMCAVLFKGLQFDFPRLARIMERDKEEGYQLQAGYRHFAGQVHHLPAVLEFLARIDDPDELEDLFDLISEPIPAPEGYAAYGGTKVARLGKALENGEIDELIAHMRNAREARDAVRMEAELKANEKANEIVETRSTSREFIKNMETDRDLQDLFAFFPKNWNPNKQGWRWQNFSFSENPENIVRKARFREAIRRHWKAYKPTTKGDIEKYVRFNKEMARHGIHLYLNTYIKAFFDGKMTEAELKKALLDDCGRKVATLTENSVVITFVDTKQTIFANGVVRDMAALSRMVDRTRLKMAHHLKSVLKQAKKSKS